MALIFKYEFSSQFSKLLWLHLYWTEKINALSHVPIRSLCVLGGQQTITQLVRAVIRLKFGIPDVNLFPKRKQPPVITSFPPKGEKYLRKISLLLKIYTGLLKYILKNKVMHNFIWLLKGQRPWLQKSLYTLRTGYWKCRGCVYVINQWPKVPGWLYVVTFHKCALCPKGDIFCKIVFCRFTGCRAPIQLLLCNESVISASATPTGASCYYPHFYRWGDSPRPHTN